MPRLTVYLIAYNESYLFPQVKKWWEDRFDVKFILYNFCSDDRTDEMAKESGWQVIDINQNDINDFVYRDVKENCWKNCETEWAWVSDFDELPGFTDLELSRLSDDVAGVRCRGWDFIDFCNNIEDAYYGVENPWLSKITLLRPKYIDKINYGLGCHYANPQLSCGSIEYHTLNLFHMKWFNISYALQRHTLYKTRMSATNIEHGAGLHYLISIEEQIQNYLDQYRKRIKLR